SRSFCTRALFFSASSTLAVTSSSPNSTRSCLVIEISSRASFTGVDAAFTSGRSMRRPVVSSGAVTMNTTSSTNITSTSGVMLMSRNPPRRPLPTLIAIRRLRWRHAARALYLVLRQHLDPRFGGRAHFFEQIADALVDVVVGNGGGNRRDQPDRRRDQSFADGGSHHR